MDLKAKVYRFLSPYIELYKNLLLFRILIIGIIATSIISLLGLVFFYRVNARFAFEKSSCISTWTLLPQAQRITGNTEVGFKDQISVFGYPLVAKQVCYSFNEIPSENSSNVFALELLGGVFKKNVNVKVSDYPGIKSSIGSGKPISIADPIYLSLDRPDNFFDYELSTNSKTVGCVKEKLIKVRCDLAGLGLEHNSKYDFRVSRSFNHVKTSGITAVDVRTITPVKITHTSIGDATTIFKKPKFIELTADKDVTAVIEASLTTQQNGKPLAVPVTVTKVGKSITISWVEDLPRGVSNSLKIGQIRSNDGGSLIEPFGLTFYTSTGPKVTAVNIGDRAVSRRPLIAVTFDQDLLESQGSTGRVYMQADGKTLPSQLSIKGKTAYLTPGVEMGKCQAFTVMVSETLESAYGLKSEAWSMRSRTGCSETVTLGHTAKGNAIRGYLFGPIGNLVVYAGAIHGDEGNTKKLLDKWVYEIEGNPGKIPLGRGLLVVPVINIDGYGSSQRLNSSGVDLNRNFPANNWKTGVIMPGGQFLEHGGGTEPLSEPESKAIGGYLTSVRPKLFLTYHSQGGVAIGNGAGTSDSWAGTYAAKSGYAHRTNSNIGNFFDYDTTGALEDWLYDKEGIPAILVELSTRYSDEWSRNVQAMWAMAGI